jgi:hypothetical protein
MKLWILQKPKGLNVAALTLGLQPRQGLAKVWAKNEAREWHFTFPNELPTWELESRWTPKSSESDYKGRNSLDWTVPYIIGKLLEINVLNGFAWPILILKAWIMAKRRVTIPYR